jgi:pilus assembly protein FimV
MLLLAVERPVDVEVDSDETVLLVVLRPVESEPMPVEVDVDNEAIELLAVERPVEVEVESDVTVLLVVLRPVESEPMPVEADVDSEAIELLAVESPVDVLVDRLASWLPLMASVLAADTVPGARLVIFWLLRLAPPFNEAKPDTWRAPTMLVPFVPPLIYAPFDRT